jgi:HemY protein
LKGLFWILALFGLAVGFSIAGKYDPGYVLLVYPPFRIELSLLLFVMALLGAFVVTYGVARLAVNTLQLPQHVRAFRQRQREEKARTVLLDAVVAYFEGRYGKAEKAAAEALDLGEFPALSAILAARAAHESKAYERRDGYMAAAESARPEQAVLRLMTQAELLTDQRRYQEALTVLKALNQIAPRYLAAQKLELKVQQQLRNWDQVLGLVTQLEKREALEPAQAEQFKISAHVENFKKRTLAGEDLKGYWHKMPAADRLNSKISLAAARHFMTLGDHQLAAEIIEQSLDKQWDSNLVRLYGDCHGKDGVKQIERAERWLLTHPRDAGLLLALGRLCDKQRLWGKAQSYLEACVSVSPDSEAHIALAQHLEKIDKYDEACKHYRKSLDLALAKVS